MLRDMGLSEDPQLTALRAAHWPICYGGLFLVTLAFARGRNVLRTASFVSAAFGVTLLHWFVFLVVGFVHVR